MRGRARKVLLLALQAAALCGAVRLLHSAGWPQQAGAAAGPVDEAESKRLTQCVRECNATKVSPADKRSCIRRCFPALPKATDPERRDWQ